MFQMQQNVVYIKLIDYLNLIAVYVYAVLPGCDKNYFKYNLSK